LLHYLLSIDDGRGYLPQECVFNQLLLLGTEHRRIILLLLALSCHDDCTIIQWSRA
jgi:hypothetical protein